MTIWPQPPTPPFPGSYTPAARAPAAGASGDDPVRLRRPVEVVATDMRAQRILTADQARDYGLIDTTAAERARG